MEVRHLRVGGGWQDPSRQGAEGPPPVVRHDDDGLQRRLGDRARASGSQAARHADTAPRLQKYLLTGMFLETSKRSRLTYLFRKLKPTVVIDARSKSSDESARILCALCMHPIA